eukprot:6187217-Pleurochrysis_carterae.AAC.1
MQDSRMLAGIGVVPDGSPMQSVLQARKACIAASQSNLNAFSIRPFAFRLLIASNSYFPERSRLSFTQSLCS